ncbi:MAG: S8 family serine peptidase, partial [Parvularculaceae bacterium]|nr:S8 family serine peptidase [Parvularculaceae bacterium]
MKTLLTASVAIGAMLAAQTGAAFAQSGSMKKIGPALEHLYKTHGANAGAQTRTLNNATSPQSLINVGRIANGEYVVIDAVARGIPTELRATMTALGAVDVKRWGRNISAKFPISQLGALEASPYLKMARPVMAQANFGLIASQGDRAMRTDVVRNNSEIDGSRTRVGVLSDSFSCTTGPIGINGWTSTADDIANGDLPAKIVNLSDVASGCIDEGRGMAQLIHDSVPGASIAFHTAFNGVADFANGIVRLATIAGSDVIVDDVIYFAEPMFQDGPIAQAADYVSSLGIPYYSSNGNRGRTAHRSDYRAVNATVGGISGTWHDFDAGAGEDLLQNILLTSSGGIAQIVLSFQWDEPNFSVSGGAGSASNVDVVMFDSAGNPVLDCFDPLYFSGLCTFFFQDGGVGGDAIDLVNLVYIRGSAADPVAQTAQIGFRTSAGPAPNLVMHVPFSLAGSLAELEWATNSGSGYGHNNAAGAEGVGASAFNFTEEFIGDPKTNNQRPPGTECAPACLNDFSSAGGTPIVFDTAGNRLATPEVRFKPGVTAPDGTNTTFFVNDTFRDDDDGDGIFVNSDPGEFPNFFGTSAAAPHAASIAAMMINKEKTHVLAIKKNGQERFRMCKPVGGSRAGGVDITVGPAAVFGQLNSGALLRPCRATEPQEIYDIMRSTAQNMTDRVSLSTGATIQTFTEVGPLGFDFDSGFGFVDAVPAVGAISPPTP